MDAGRRDEWCVGWLTDRLTCVIGWVWGDASLPPLTCHLQESTSRPVQMTTSAKVKLHLIHQQRPTGAARPAQENLEQGPAAAARPAQENPAQGPSANTTNRPRTRVRPVELARSSWKLWSQSQRTAQALQRLQCTPNRPLQAMM